jgi:hypothetical protein
MALRKAKANLRAALRWMDSRPWLIALIIVAVVMTPGFYRLETIVKEIRGTQQSGSPTLKAIGRTLDAIESQQDEIKAAADASVATQHFILDCTDPKGECAKRSAAQVAAQAGEDLAASVASIYCHFQEMPQDYTYEQLLSCVENQLDAHRGGGR